MWYPCNSGRLKTFRSTRCRCQYETKDNDTRPWLRAYNIEWVNRFALCYSRIGTSLPSPSSLSTICQYWGRPYVCGRNQKVPENLCIDEIYLPFLFNINTCLSKWHIGIVIVGSGGCGNGAKSFTTKIRNCVHTNGDTVAQPTHIVRMTAVLLILIPWWPSRRTRATHHIRRCGQLNLYI